MLYKKNKQIIEKKRAISRVSFEALASLLGLELNSIRSVSVDITRDLVLVSHDDGTKGAISIAESQEAPDSW